MIEHDTWAYEGLKYVSIQTLSEFSYLYPSQKKKLHTKDQRS